MKESDKDPPGFFPNPFKWLWHIVFGKLLSWRWWVDVLIAQFRAMKFWEYDKDKAAIWIASSNFTWLQYTLGGVILAKAKILAAKTLIFSKAFASAMWIS